MRNRCNSPTNPRYNDYGGRGINICKEWDKFCVFEEWAVNNGYGEKLTIERKDNDKNYSPYNCVWATYKTQGNNSRHCHYLTLGSERKTMKQWAEHYGINYYTLRSRITICKWTIEKALDDLSNQSKRYVTYGGKTLSVIDWAKETGIPCVVLSDRLNKLKWSVEKALTTPVRKITKNSLQKTYYAKNI